MARSHVAAMHHHAGWLADVAMRGVIYNTINRLMRGLGTIEVLMLCALAVIIYLNWRRP